MTATNSLKSAKDGTGAAFNITFAAESISGNKAPKNYIGSPASEGLIEPAQEGTDVTAAVQLTGGTGIRGWLSGCFTRLSSILSALGTPMQATGGTVGLVAGVALIGKAGIDQTSFGASNAVSMPPSSSGAIGLASIRTTVLASSLVLKNSPGNLYDTYVTAGATPGFLMLFDSIAPPGDGAVVPVECFVIPASVTTRFNFNPPRVYGTGITMVFSSTGPYTKTASATVFMSGRVA